MPPTRPRAVVWDVGHVLYDWDPRFLYEKLIEDEAVLEDFLGRVVTRTWHFQHDAGRRLSDTIPELVARHPGYRTLIELYAERWLETIPGPIAGTHPLVEELDEAGVPQFAITNFGAEFWDMFRPTAPLFDRFDGIIVSGREKLMKPDPAIYALAEERFGLSGADLLFVDDNPANVAAAAARGWRAHRFVDADAARRALRAEGLPV